MIRCRVYGMITEDILGLKLRDISRMLLCVEYSQPPCRPRKAEVSAILDAGEKLRKERGCKASLFLPKLDP